MTFLANLLGLTVWGYLLWRAWPGVRGDLRRLSRRRVRGAFQTRRRGDVL